jgi:hemolysin activation/secretion protein
VLDAKGTALSMGEKLDYTILRTRKASLWGSVFLSFRGQFSNKNLDSSQKFILGGPTGVRAYPVGEGSGDEGSAITGEVRYDLDCMPSWLKTQLVGFADTGRVRLHKDVWDGAVTNATGKNSYRLSGWGAGVNFSQSDRFSLRLAYSRAIGDNDGRNSDGTNTDNLGGKGSVWLQGVIHF